MAMMSLTPGSASTGEKALSFGIRGDCMLQCYADDYNGKKARWRNFKTDFYSDFWAAFGHCDLSYEFVDNLEDKHATTLRDVTKQIEEGPEYDVLVVNIMIHDLIAKRPWNDMPDIVKRYPPLLDKDLADLSEAMHAKAQGSLVILGGPAEFWSFPDRWNHFMARARNKLRRQGLQVVPPTEMDPIMLQMRVSSDGKHICNEQEGKTAWSANWIHWLKQAADPIFGTELEEVPPNPDDRPRKRKGDVDADDDNASKHLKSLTAKGKGKGKSGGGGTVITSNNIWTKGKNSIVKGLGKDPNAKPAAVDPNYQPPSYDDLFGLKKKDD